MPSGKGPGRPVKLNEETSQKICAYIRAGAFAHIAAGAAGIGLSTFMSWMQDSRPMYLEFQEEVNKAKAQARLAAEIKVKTTNPVAWLRLGPGRDKPNEPGWTESAKVELTGKDGSPINPPASQVDFSRLSTDELREYIALGRKLAGGGAAGGTDSG